MTKFSFTQNLFVFVSMLLFASCMTTNKFVARANKNTKVIPADYDPTKHILLVADLPKLNKPEERSDAATNKLDKALKEYCPYKYEIVSMEDIENIKTKYRDTSIYKYAILNSLNSVRHSSTTKITNTTSSGTFTHSVSPSARTTYIDFLFYDRVNNREYPKSGNEAAKIEWAMAAYIDIIKKAKG